MALIIYKITNKINNKTYIGQTKRSLYVLMVKEKAVMALNLRS